MLAPRVFRRNGFFDDFDDIWNFEPSFARRFDGTGRIVTDVKEVSGGYEIDMELPGYKKDEVSVELKDGYLVVSAEHNDKNDKKDKDGNYIRQERFYGKSERSFYVGDNVKEEEIKAKFEDGVLKITVPKEEDKPKVEDKKYIPID